MAVTSPLQSVVLINFDFLRCDGFLIQQHNIRILNLPGVQDLEMCKKIIALTSHSFTKYLLLERLKWLWDVVAGPVLDALGFPGGCDDRRVASGMLDFDWSVQFLANSCCWISLYSGLPDCA
jgi:hypothetical protein